MFPTTPWDEKPIKHYTQVVQITIHHFYITGDIEEEVERYTEMLNTLKTSEPQDRIFIYLNTPGGSLSTAIQIVSAITSSPAEVITVMEGEVCSAGTFIFLSGDLYVVKPNCSFLAHNYSHGTMGKGAEVAAHVNFSQQYAKELIHSFYDGFLTPKEIDQICEDRDFWMTSNDVIKRLKKRDPDKVIDDVNMEVEMEEEPAPPKPKRTPARKNPPNKTRKKKAARKIPVG
jgi:ATP-dependent Clp protease protease subunit